MTGAAGAEIRRGSGATRPVVTHFRVHWVATAIGLVVAAIGFSGVDRWLYDWSVLYTNTPDPIDPDFYQRSKLFWSLLRQFGMWPGVAAVYFILLLVRRDGWSVANRMLACVVLCSLATYAIKFVAGRERPNQAVEKRQTHLSFRPFTLLRDAAPPAAGDAASDDRTMSFPSGEATVAFSLATVLSLLFRRGWPLFYALALGTCAARLVQGAHFVSDVAAGAALAIVLTLLVWKGLQHAWPSSTTAAQAEAPSSPDR